MAESADFRELLLRAVDHGLMVLGAGVRRAMYDRFERSQGIKREEIPEKLELFHEALIAALGAGGGVVERLIAKNLYGQLGLDFPQYQGWVLVDYVAHAKKSTMIAPARTPSSEVDNSG